MENKTIIKHETANSDLGAVSSSFSSQIFEMKYPKNKITAFIRLSENNHPQVNLHKGSVYNYWFIEPSEKPIKLTKGQIPELLKNADLGDLGSF